MPIEIYAILSYPQEKNSRMIRENEPLDLELKNARNIFQTIECQVFVDDLDTFGNILQNG